VKDDFSIRSGSKRVPETLELATKFPEIVYLAIEDHPDGFIGIGHRLVSTFEVYDRQTSETQSQRTIKMVTLVVGASVR